MIRCSGKKINRIFNTKQTNLALIICYLNENFRAAGRITKSQTTLLLLYKNLNFFLMKLKVFHTGSYIKIVDCVGKTSEIFVAYIKISFQNNN